MSSLETPPVEAVRYRNQATQRVTSSHSSSLSTYQDGGRVRILYLAEEPEQARIDTFASFWPGPLLLTGGGIVFVAIGYSFLRGARRH